MFVGTRNVSRHRLTPPNASQVGEYPRVQALVSHMASEARALLTLAALREAIPAERAQAFAAGVLAESDLGRWALAVLRGEPDAARAVVELANARLQRDTIDMSHEQRDARDDAGKHDDNSR